MPAVANKSHSFHKIFYKNFSSCLFRCRYCRNCHRNCPCFGGRRQADIGIDFSYWGSNDGKGLETQKECNKLADALESFVSKIDFVDDEDWFGIYTGSWSTLDGGFVDDKITKKCYIDAQPVG